MSYVVTCPYCSTQVRVPDRQAEKTFICPRCLADVNNPPAQGTIRAVEVEPGRPASQIQRAEINTDVRRDLSVGSIVLTVLIGLCVLGISIVLFMSTDWGGGYRSISIAFALMFPFAGLDVLVSIAIIRGFLRRGVFDSDNPGFGTALGIMFLSLGTIGAVCIFFFFTCLGLLKLD
jgi:hypothetical protein